jgi:hypothetical protein
LLLTLAASVLLVGCAGGGAWPQAARGYIDANQDGVRQKKEYIEPTFEFGPQDTVLIINRVHQDRRGQSLRMIVWAPDRQTVVARYTTTVHDRDVITHYRTTARELIEQGGYGRYLVNWRIEQDTIDAYEIDIRPTDPDMEELLDIDSGEIPANRPSVPTSVPDDA